MDCVNMYDEDKIEMKVNIDLQKPQVCRLCLGLTTTCFSLIANHGASQMLEALTSLKILPTDEISTIMCLKCSLNLKLAFKIQQNMVKAEQKFRNHVSAQINTRNSNEVNKIEVVSDDDADVPLSDLIKTEIKEGQTKKESICDLCGEKFPTTALKNQHKDDFHVILNCPVCKKSLCRDGLQRHIKRHTDSVTICEVCGVPVKNMDLGAHIKRKHVRPLSYKCDFCDKVFKRASNRKIHMKKEHLDEADFVCDTCGKKFYRKRDIKKHVESKHLKLRPHICEICNVGFSTRFAKRTHMRKHTDERPFKCEICADGFRHKVSLKVHLKSKHNVEEELTCECRECGKKFGSNAALSSHKRIH